MTNRMDLVDHSRTDTGSTMVEREQRRATGARANLERLYDAGRELTSNGDGVDDAWTTAVSGILARAVADQDEALIADTQNRMRRLAALVDRSIDAAQDARRRADSDVSEITRSTDITEAFNPREQLVEVPQVVDGMQRVYAMRVALARVQSVRAFADAAAGIVRPRVWAQLEPDSLKARVLLVLSPDRATSGEQVREVVETTDTQLSRAFRELSDSGLVQRRAYGRKAVWTLTGSGAEAAHSLRTRNVEDAFQSEHVAQDAVDAYSRAASSVSDLLAQHAAGSGVVISDADELSAAVEVQAPYIWFSHLASDNLEQRDAVDAVLGKASGSEAALYCRINDAVVLSYPNGRWSERFSSLLGDMPRLLVAPSSDCAYLKVEDVPESLASLALAMESGVDIDAFAPLARAMDQVHGAIAAIQVRVAPKSGTDDPGRRGHHVMRNPAGGWDVIPSGLMHATAHSTTKREAVARAKEILQNSGGGELAIHRADGTLQERSEVAESKPRRKG